MTHTLIQHYLNRLEEATNCHFIFHIDPVEGSTYHLMDACGDLIAEFEQFEDLHRYTIETVEHIEESRGVKA